jgi:hypothetical protein
MTMSDHRWTTLLGQVGPRLIGMDTRIFGMDGPPLCRKRKVRIAGAVCAYVYGLVGVFNDPGPGQKTGDKKTGKTGDKGKQVTGKQVTGKQVTGKQVTDRTITYIFIAHR